MAVNITINGAPINALGTQISKTISHGILNGIRTGLARTKLVPTLTRQLQDAVSNGIAAGAVQGLSRASKLSANAKIGRGLGSLGKNAAASAIPSTIPAQIAKTIISNASFGSAGNVIIQNARFGGGGGGYGRGGGRRGGGGEDLRGFRYGIKDQMFRNNLGFVDKLFIGILRIHASVWFVEDAARNMVAAYKAATEGLDVYTKHVNRWNMGIEDELKRNYGTFGKFVGSSYGTARDLRMSQSDYREQVMTAMPIFQNAIYRDEYDRSGNKIREGTADAFGIIHKEGEKVITSFAQGERIQKNLIAMTKSTSTNAQEMNALMIQIIQGISKGYMDLTDIKPMLNTSPHAADALARFGFGLAGAADLVGAAGNKSLRADILLNNLMSEELEKHLSKMVNNTIRTWDEVTQMMQNTFERWELPLTEMFARGGDETLGDSLIAVADAMFSNEEANELFRDQASLFYQGAPELLLAITKAVVTIPAILKLIMDGVVNTLSKVGEWIGDIVASLPMALMTGLTGPLLGILQESDVAPDWFKEINLTGKLNNWIRDELTPNIPGLNALSEIGREVKDFASAWDTMTTRAGALDLSVLNDLYSGAFDERWKASMDALAKKRAERGEVGDYKSPLSALKAIQDNTKKTARNTAKATEVQLALLKQVAGSRVINRVTHISPNVVSNVGTIKNGVEYEEMLKQLSSTVEQSAQRMALYAM